MLLRLLLVLLLAASAASAEGPVYKDVAFADIFTDWDRATRGETPGLSIMEPQKLHFVAGYAAGPTSCKTGLLKAIFSMQGMADALAKVPISHCIVLVADSGRKASVFVQDVLVPGLEHDATVGGRLDVHVDLIGYLIKVPGESNAPVLLLNRFEPIEAKKG